MNKIKIVPSILSADAKSINNEIKKIEPYADLIHVDVMDGRFVVPVTFSLDETRKIKTSLPMEAHLMVEYPENKWIEEYVKVGCFRIIIHQEATKNLIAGIEKAKSLGAKIALAIKPATPLKNILPYIKEIDMVLIMSVNPGYAGQKFMPEVVFKIRELRKIDKAIDIEVDGGLNNETLIPCIMAGANVIVAASAIFKNNNPISAIKELRRIALQTALQ